MWQLFQPAPGTFERCEVPAPSSDDVAAGEVLLRFGAGAICGSDIPKFLGFHDPDNPYTGLPGVPLHEFVGRVEFSRDPRFAPGDRVVGIIARSRGLAEFVVNPGEYVHRIDDAFDDIAATVIQPLSTVLSAYDNIVDVRDRTVAVMGLGPLGLLFAHVAKARGARRVIGIDRVDRNDVGATFGVDEVVSTDVHTWAEGLGTERPDIVVDAIGHRQEHIADAVTALEPGGVLLVFGLPEDQYVFPMRTFFRKGLTMWAGATLDWPRFLDEAQRYLLHHRDLPKHYITDVFPLEDATSAYTTYAFPRRGRLKVALTGPSA